MPTMPALLIGSLCLLLSGAARAAEVRVAVAANFSEPMRRIARLFEQQSSHHVQLSSGASGSFYAQIVAGAPYDVLLSADRKIPAALVDAGLAIASTRATYARGRLALWSTDASLVDYRGAVLTLQGWHHLAIANPKLAPYGAAAMQVLQARDLLQRLSSHLVQGESITQTWQFVATGNAELGFVAWSQLIDGNGQLARGSAWLVPETLHEPILQDLVLLSRAKDNAAARELLAFMRTDPVLHLIRDAGYGSAP